MVRFYVLRILFCASAICALVSCKELVEDPLSETPVESPTDASAVPGMNYARSGHTASRLVDGRVLVVGGLAGHNTSEFAEIYDPSTNVWTIADSPIVPDRQHARSVTLHDGRVLIVGGSSGTYPVGPREVEVYDPADGMFHLVGMSANSRDGSTVTLLNDGRVLILGGSEFDFVHLKMNYFKDGEIFDPSTNQLHPIHNSMKHGRTLHSAAVMPSGDVLVTGGEGVGGSLTLAEIFQIGNEALVETNPMRDSRKGHSTFAVGSEMIVIGESTHTNTAIPIAELYVSAFSSLSASSFRIYGSAKLQAQDSSIYFFGGHDPLSTSHSGSIRDSILVYDPVTSSFSLRGSLSTPRLFPQAVEMLDGSFLIIGGWTNDGDTNSVERIVF